MSNADSSSVKAVGALTAPRIPLTLLSGFLGSGKTTLVNQVIASARGNIGVVVNEFGEQSIDAALIGQSDGLVELNNGCVCCASRGNLPRAIVQLLSLNRRFEHILVEASGLVDPGPVVETLISPSLLSSVNFFGTITVVDAVNFDANLDHAEAAYAQFTQADLLILNKFELVTADEADAIEGRLRRLNAVAPVIRTARCELDAELVLTDWTELSPSDAVDALRFRAVKHAGQGSRAEEDAQPTHRTHDFSAVSLQLREPVALDTVSHWLAELPATVVRAKGVIRLPNDEVRAVHRVGTAVGVDRLLRPEAVPGSGALVLIGSQLDVVALPPWLDVPMLRR